MLKISGRVTNSFFRFLDQRYFDTSRFYELSNMEMHFIKDPSVWMEADLVENFLKELSEEFGRHFVDKELTTAVGHAALELGAWGELDHVLKLGPVFNIYQKLSDILQWFVSPLHLDHIQYKYNLITCECELSSDDYPYLVEYMRSVLEVLPTYKSEAMTEVEWKGKCISIRYTPYGQMSFFAEKHEMKNLMLTSPRITKIHGRELLDSRGFPALEVEVWSSSGGSARAMVPSGASTGRFEALELRDHDKKRFHGKGLLKACENVLELSQKLRGVYLDSLEDIDRKLIELDGTENKRKWGANVILGISLACLQLLAQMQKKSVYSFFKSGVSRLPIPLINVLNGGSHADNNLDVQEFMLVPHGFSSFREAIRAGSEIFHTLKKDLQNKNYSTSVGDEGGAAPSLKSNEEALELLVSAIEKAGYQPGRQVSLALDAAASSIYKNGLYLWEGGKINADDLIEIYDGWINKYPLVSIEDGLEEEQWEDWKKWSRLHSKKIQIVGDDLFVTNSKRLKKGIENKIANALLVKVNQIGTVTEAHEAVRLAHQSGYQTVLSHRSGETEDSVIADLSIAFECQQIKTGGVSRGERTAKYNRLLRIEEELGGKAKYHQWLKG